MKTQSLLNLNWTFDEPFEFRHDSIDIIRHGETPLDWYNLARIFQGVEAIPLAEQYGKSTRYNCFTC